MSFAGLSRRQFLERLGILGGIGAAYYGLGPIGLLPPANAAAGPPQINYNIGGGRHVVILGAGIAGLCAAYLLRNTQFKVTIIEPARQVGGRCLTLRGGDIIAEQHTDSHGEPFKPAVCQFDHDPQLYLNAGASRIPQSHSAILRYCRELKVKLQPFIFACRSNLLQNDQFNGGKPVPLRWVKHDLRGHIAEILMHAARDDQLAGFVRPENRRVFNQMVKYFGSLKESKQSLKYRGTRRGGYAKKPGAGPVRGTLRESFELNEILASGIWHTGLLSDMYLYWQSSLMQAEGGMDHIPRAFKKNLGANARLLLNRQAVGINRAADKVYIQQSGSGETLAADYCISTMAPPLLSTILDQSFAPDFKAALARTYMVPACKVGWQTKNRFWEEETEIYGGISWTKHMISQVWYPSHGFHSQKGVLTGAYMFGNSAESFGSMSNAARLAVAMAGGEKLHPGLFKQNIENGVSIAWQNMPGQAGGWAYYRNQPENPDYMKINEPQGRLLLAGDYYSYLSGWMEGAVLSAELAVKRLTRMAAEKKVA
ncbi:MAG: FAD-dependent oxidoreductase [Desulfobacterales bacterium]|nr:FAD-dependent oxidoreductase [Desulfobacterales bacterium]